MPEPNINDKRHQELSRELSQTNLPVGGEPKSNKELGSRAESLLRHSISDASDETYIGTESICPVPSNRSVNYTALLPFASRRHRSFEPTSSANRDDADDFTSRFGAWVASSSRQHSLNPAEGSVWTEDLHNFDRHMSLQKHSSDSFKTYQRAQRRLRASSVFSQMSAFDNASDSEAYSDDSETETDWPDRRESSLGDWGETPPTMGTSYRHICISSPTSELNLCVEPKKYNSTLMTNMSLSLDPEVEDCMKAIESGGYVFRFLGSLVELPGLH